MRPTLLLVVDRKSLLNRSLLAGDPLISWVSIFSVWLKKILLPPRQFQISKHFIRPF
jgi:hypothetical protein